MLFLRLLKKRCTMISSPLGYNWSDNVKNASLSTQPNVSKLYVIYKVSSLTLKKNIHQLLFVLYTGLYTGITLWAKLHIQKKVCVKRHITKQQCGYFCKRLSQKCCNIKFLIYFFRHAVCFSRIVCLSLCVNDLLSQLLQYPRTLFCWKTHN